jgi:hypothetical protein
MALSLIEVEIMAALEGARLVIWLKKLIRDLGEITTTLLSLRSTITIRV